MIRSSSSYMTQIQGWCCKPPWGLRTLTPWLVMVELPPVPGHTLLQMGRCLRLVFPCLSLFLYTPTKLTYLCHFHFILTISDHVYLNDDQLWFTPERLALIVEDPWKLYLYEEKTHTFCVLHDVELDVDLSTFGSDNMALAAGSPGLPMRHHHKHSNVPMILFKRKICDLLQKPVSSHLFSRNNFSIESCTWI